MSTDTSASPSRALRSPSRIIASGTAASHESPSLQSTTGRTSFVSPSPGFPYTSSQGTSSMLINQGSPPMHRHPIGPRFSSLVLRRRRLLESIDDNQRLSGNQLGTSTSSPRRHVEDSVATAQSLSARKLNDSLVYLDGPQIYTCAQCRTHLTSHDEIISKSFHGRHGRAYLFDHCVNVKIGPAEDRLLITGLHSVNDIFCKRCKNMIGWTYSRAYEHSQKYKEGKFIVEKVNLHLEESDYYDVAPPAGERKDRFRARSISWGSDARPRCGGNSGEAMVYEYRPSSTTSSTSHLG